MDAAIDAGGLTKIVFSELSKYIKEKYFVHYYYMQ
jgi:hypothetical protein